MYNDEQIVMTPTKRSQDLTTVTMERLKISEMDQNNIIHIGGGDHTGLIIYKEPGGTGKSSSKPPELVLGFRVILKSEFNNKYEQENWQLKFWFKRVHDREKIESAEAFLTELISAEELPKDYAGFIKKTMKLMQLKYPCVKKIEVEMKKHKEVRNSPHPPQAHVEVEMKKNKEVRNSPQPPQSHMEVEMKRRNDVMNSPHVSQSQKVEVEMKKQKEVRNSPQLPQSYENEKSEMKKHREMRNSPQLLQSHKVEPEIKKHREVRNSPQLPQSPASNVFESKIMNSKLTAEQEKLLEIIEAVYPNSLSVASISKSSSLPEEEIINHLKALEMRGQVKCLSNGNFMRTTKNDSDIKIAKQMPMIAQAKQPVIAIITAQYCEKLAVDAMIENKETFVKFKTEGESNVYTLGTVGQHRVVSTKLPATGMARGAMIAAGSTITRLLGSFPRVDYVFLVGVGGGVPHCYDYSKHVRLGDVVISTPPDQNHSYIYLYCESTQNGYETTNNDYLSSEFSIKTWCPPSLKLQKIACDLWRKGVLNTEDRPWDYFIEQSLQQLSDQESSFCRPSPETDKLYYMSSEDGEIVDFGHPQPMEGTFDPRKPNMPVLHFGAVGSGRVLMQDDTKRLSFADHHGIMSFDTGFGSVVESIFGNRKDDYVFIRGIADYKDGTKKKEWQPYAALAAAAVMKSIICNLVCD